MRVPGSPKTDPVVDRSLTMSGAFAFPAENEYVTFNDPAIQAAEIPGANGISTAESLAACYAACVSRSTDRRSCHASTIEDALRPRSAGPQLSGMPDDGSSLGNGLSARLTPDAADARAGQLRARREPVGSSASVTSSMESASPT